ncbi:Receptor-like protein kinase 1 [Theobroma cacao]|uniref:non-specific serine/threonine protein kinase n=1 Tax=Theobroma cacao TaxID=3641 RepID=A0A061GTI8_THECC|nr:Receptor-like protein kinase 1 [Theobroma cacao]
MVIWFSMIQQASRSGLLVWLELGVSYAAMLDTGNFVLAREDSRILWQSFDNPTDTILPTQVMNQDSQLIARYTETNYSSGRFKFILQRDGNLLLYTTNFPFDDNVAAYWSAQTSIGSGFQVISNQSGNIYLTARKGSILNMVFSTQSSTQDFYLKAIVDYDGVFRQYAYPKSVSTSNGRWPRSWTTLSLIPSNICMRIGRDNGSGACGYNSYCILGDDQRPICDCVPGYSFIDTNDIRKGCRPNFTFCEETSQETDLYQFILMNNADWPDSSYESFKEVTEDWCRLACLNDCFCAVATFRDGECRKKKTPLANGRVDPEIGGKALLKVRNNSTASKNSAKDKKDQSIVIRVVSVLLGGFVFVNFLLLLVTLTLIFRLKRKQAEVQPQKVMPPMNLLSFPCSELDKATNGFQEELGCGAFGTVYKGELASEPTELVAAKKLNKMERDGEQEFQAEVRAIGRTNHKNLVQLLGFCNEGQNRLLVYEYMSNGSLAKFLFANARPNWYQRIQIAFGIAIRLFYLHEECSSQIIHCNIKPQNILLDDSFSAKISDFGLAKLLKKDQTRTTTAIRGTKGYVAPEWFRNMPITVEVDVYSFGILLLELICCRKNFEPNVKEEDQMILVDWAYDCFMERKLQLLVENDEEATDEIKKVKKFVMIAVWCIQEDPSLRPTMKKVVQMMEGVAETKRVMLQADALYIVYDIRKRKIISIIEMCLQYPNGANQQNVRPSSTNDCFKQIGNDGFLLAIWFNKIPGKTIVWSANRNNLLQSGSKVDLTRVGWLVLRDQTGRQIWTPISTGIGVSYAAMLDTGNFVLAGQDSTILWQSFDDPTDTILPTGFQVIFNLSGSIYLTSRNGSILNTVFPTALSTEYFYLRATVDYDGVFRQYAYPKSATTGNATFRDGEYKKKIPLANGRVDPNIGGKALIKRKQTKIQPQKVMSATNLQSSTYNELEKATNGFKEELGHGAFGTVYKGMLASKGWLCRKTDLDFIQESLIEKGITMRIREVEGLLSLVTFESYDEMVILLENYWEEFEQWFENLIPVDIARSEGEGEFIGVDRSTYKRDKLDRAMVLVQVRSRLMILTKAMLEAAGRIHFIIVSIDGSESTKEMTVYELGKELLWEEETLTENGKAGHITTFDKIAMVEMPVRGKYVGGTIENYGVNKRRMVSRRGFQCHS